MKNKFKKILSVLAFCGLAGIITTTPVLAESCTANDICNCDVAEEVKVAYGCPGATSTDVSTVIQNILLAIIGVLGIVAVIFIVMGGINYITSAGDSAKLKKAKDTILYACIGLVISVLAFAIVNFTIGIIKGSQGGGNPEQYTSQQDCEKNHNFTWDTSTNTCK